MKTLLYGAGALGTVLGGLLSAAGEDVLLVSRNKAHIAALREHGAKLSGSLDVTVPVQAALPGEITGEYDFIILMTKQLDNAATAAFLKPHLAAGGVICTCQNGIPELSLRDSFADDEIAGCIITWSATFAGPGESVLTSPAGSVRFVLGSPFGGGTAEKAAAVLQKAGPCEIMADYLRSRWNKLVSNSSVSALTSALGLPCGAAAEEPELQPVTLRLIRECVRVQRACGVADGALAAQLYTETDDDLPAAAAKMPAVFASIRLAESSILQDLRRGRRTEAPALNGLVCRLGAQYGRPTPYHSALLALLTELEEGKGTPCRENLQRLYALL